MVKKAVAAKPTFSLVAEDTPQHVLASETSGRGNENVGQQLAIPRIKLLQKMSNEVDKHHAAYVEGAEPGQFVNTITGKNYGSELYAISLSFNTEYNVWRDIEKGGGFKGSFSTLGEAEKRVAEQDVPLDHEIKETHAHLLLLKDPETGELDPTPCVMDFASAKLRVSKAWNSQIGMKGRDRFSGLWCVSGVPTENKMGKAFMNVDVSWVGWAHDEDYLAAEKMYEAHANTSFSAAA